MHQPRAVWRDACPASGVTRESDGCMQLLCVVPTLPGFGVTMSVQAGQHKDILARHDEKYTVWKSPE